MTHFERENAEIVAILVKNAVSDGATIVEKNGRGLICLIVSMLLPHNFARTRVIIVVCSSSVLSMHLSRRAEEIDSENYKFLPST